MSEKDKPAGAGFFGTKKLLKKYKKDTPGESVEEVYRNSGLGKWFHSQSAGGKPGWDRYNTKGERVGECGDSKPGEGKPKCLSKQKAAKLRSQGGKNAIANAVKRKKAQDPQQDRPGTGNKPINVSNRIKKEDRDMKSAKEFLNDMIMEQLNEDVLNEKNVPTDPGKWSKAKAQARAKFDVYPSAYANAWASKKYKAMGGSWTTKESAEEVGPEIAEELIDLDLSEAKKKRITKLHGKYPKGTHYCATHVEHAEFGHGNPIHSQHATPDEFGDIEWYDVMFEHGIEQGVPTDDLHIHLGEVHENHDHEEGEDLGEGPAHQNPLKTTYGGMKAAQNTPSMKAYYAKVKKDQAARAKQIEQERKDGIRSKYESVEQVDELKMPEKDKRGRAKDPVIGAALERGSRRADLKAHGKLRRGDTDGAEGHMTRSRKRQAASRVESVDLDELSTDTLRRYVYNRRGQVQSDLNTGRHSPKTNKSAKGVVAALSRLDARKNKLEPELKREDVERIDELSPKTLKSYESKARKKVVDNLSRIDGNHSEADLRKRAKGLLKAKGKLGEAKVGDTVHLGHATKGGSGVKGKVVKIDGKNVHIKNDKGAMFKGPMDRVTVGEAIKYDSAGDSTGTVTGKGKRDRGPGGKVMVKYKGSDTYKDGAKLPIKARDIGRLIKTARKKGTKPYDSRNLSNPRLTKDHVEHGVDEGAGADAILKYARENPGAFGNKKKSKSGMKGTSYRYIKDKKTGVTKLYTQGRDAKLTFVRDVQDHVEHGVDEGMADSAKRAAKILAARTPKNVHNPGRPTKKSAGDIEAARREKARRDSIDRRAARDKEMLNNREGVEDMTAAQERDRQHRDNPTRKTVAGVRLPSTDKERASYVKKFQADKAGKPGNTKPRKMRDLRMRLRGPK